MIHRTAALPAVLLLLASCGARTVDPAGVAAIANQVVSAYEQAGISLPPGVVVRAVTPAEMEDAAAPQMIAQLNVLIGAGEEVPVDARDAVGAEARGLLVRYVADTQEVLVAPANVEAALAGAADPPGTAEETLRGLLFHEAAHALVEAWHQESARRREAGDLDRSMVVHALAEGYAQLLARRAAEASGFAAELIAVTGGVAAGGVAAPGAGTSGEPSTPAEVLALGERFVAALLAAGGTAAVERAFAEPPVELRELEDAGAFLTRPPPPAPRYALDAGLDAIVPLFPDADATRSSLPRRALRQSLAFLPEEDAERLVDGILQDRSLVLRLPGGDADDGGVVAGVSLREHRTPADARAVLDALRAATAAKGGARLEERAGAGGAWAGIYALPAAGTGRVASFLVLHDALSVSVVFPEPLDEELATRVADAAVAAAAPR